MSLMLPPMCEILVQADYHASSPAPHRRARLERVALQRSPRLVWRCLRYLITVFRVNRLPHLRALIADKQWLEDTFGLTPRYK